MQGYRSLFLTYNVTKWVRQGSNVVGAMLGSGPNANGGLGMSAPPSLQGIAHPCKVLLHYRVLSALPASRSNIEASVTCCSYHAPVSAETP